MTFTVHTVLDALKSFDYTTVAKMAVPYESFTSGESPASRLLTLAHLLIYGTLLGTMLWVTFVSGVVLFKSLERKTFSVVQVRWRAAG